MVSRKREIEKIGLFITDASFDSKTKVASIAIVDIKTKAVYSIQKSANNVKESETTGIFEGLSKAVGKYSNIVVFCDNQGSVKYVSEKIKTSEFWSSKFLTIQIIWLPREETFVADFFTKNVEDSDKNMSLKIESFKNECKTSNVMDLFLTKEDKQKIIKDLFDESFKEYELLKTFNFSSILLKNIFEQNNFNNKSEDDFFEIKKDCESLFKLNPDILDKKSSFYRAIQGLLNTN